jgi:hypothetical protein
MTVIPLGAGLLRRSSHLPARSASSIIARLFGVAPGGGCRVSPAIRFDPSGDSSLWPCSSPWASREGRLLRTAVSRHPALWSPDFPPAQDKSAPATVWPTSLSSVHEGDQASFQWSVSPARSGTMRSLPNA